MNSLTVPWNEPERLNVQKEIENLFRLKGYRMADKSLTEVASVFVENLSTQGLHPKIILSALHKLKFEKINRIDIADILDAAEDVVEPVETNHCDECVGGFILMQDPKGYTFSLACKCSADEPRMKNLKKWNGESTQKLHSGLGIKLG